ncbi:MAG: dihydroorotase [Planctomycetes bacterium]|nr:dihydroorotase [Planctomycetota bacterium]
MADLLIKGGRVIDPVQGLDKVMDLRLGKGRVVEMGERLAAGGADVIDAAGCIVAPGFIDLHAHFRQPGHEDEETIASGAAAAVKGGYTTVCVMANTDPAIDNEAGVEFVRKMADAAGLCDVLPVAAATLGRGGEQITEMHRLRKHGAVAVSDDGAPVRNAALMRTILSYAADAGLPVLDHAEDPELAGDGIMNEGEVSDITGIPGVPQEAESVMVERDAALAGLTGGRLHVQHISTGASVDAVRRARGKGWNVTAEVTPHHLLLDERKLETFDPVYKVNPPLRPAAVRALLLEALKEGVISAIATDHAPHRDEEKELDLLEAPNGMASIECAFSVLYTGLVEEGRLGIGELLAALTSGPAGVLGLEDRGSLAAGKRGDVTVIDPAGTWVVGEGGYASRSSNCPYAGMRVKGVVKATVVRGRVVYGG